MTTSVCAISRLYKAMKSSSYSYIKVLVRFVDAICIKKIKRGGGSYLRVGGGGSGSGGHGPWAMNPSPAICFRLVCHRTDQRDNFDSTEQDTWNYSLSVGRLDTCRFVNCGRRQEPLSTLSASKSRQYVRT
jgi:hypothetical protein